MVLSLNPINPRAYMLDLGNPVKSGQQSFAGGYALARQPIVDQQKDADRAHLLERRPIIEAQQDQAAQTLNLQRQQQIAGAQQQAVINRQKMQQQQENINREKEFRSDILAGDMSKDEMAKKYPVLYGKVFELAESLDENTQKVLLQSSTSILGLAKSGNWELATKKAEETADAFKNAGHPMTQQVEQIAKQFKNPNPEERKAALTSLLLLNQGLGGEKVAKPTAGDAYEKYVREQNAAGVPKDKILDRIGFAQAIKGKGFEVTLADGTKVTYGNGSGGNMAKKTEGKIENKIVTNIDSLSSIDRIDELYDRDFLTYQGAIGATITKYADKFNLNVGDGKKEFLGARAKFVNSVEQSFNQYRKEITGAAASVQELDRLKKSFINLDMSPIEFEAAMENYKSELKRSMRVYMKLRREGIDPATKEGGKAFDSEFLGGGDDDIEKRGDELSKSGMSDKEIALRLRKEGY